MADVSACALGLDFFLFPPMAGFLPPSFTRHWRVLILMFRRLSSAIGRAFPPVRAVWVSSCSRRWRDIAPLFLPAIGGCFHWYLAVYLLVLLVLAAYFWLSWFVLFLFFAVRSFCLFSGVFRWLFFALPNPLK